MVAIGRYNRLQILEKAPQGIYLDGQELGKILLPKRFTNDQMHIDDYLEVFILFDSEDRLVASLKTPRAQVGEFALLNVIDTNNVGAFLDWGMDKDLLLPFGEQRKRVQSGDRVLVHIYLDNASERITASAKIDKFLDNTPPPYGKGEEVDLVIATKTDLGFKAIVNNKHWGVLFHNEVNQALPQGKKLKGYIKQVRRDDKIDLCLHKNHKAAKDDASDKIIATLKQNEGFLAVHDKSEPELIKRTFGLSKAAFKRAIGNLYKQKLIIIEKDGIRLV